MILPNKKHSLYFMLVNVINYKNIMKRTDKSTNLLTLSDPKNNPLWQKRDARSQEISDKQKEIEGWKKKCNDFVNYANREKEYQEQIQIFRTLQNHQQDPVNQIYQNDENNSIQEDDTKLEINQDQESIIQDDRVEEKVSTAPQVYNQYQHNSDIAINDTKIYLKFDNIFIPCDNITPSIMDEPNLFQENTTQIQGADIIQEQDEFFQNYKFYNIYDTIYNIQNLIDLRLAPIWNYNSDSILELYQ